MTAIRRTKSSLSSRATPENPGTSSCAETTGRHSAPEKDKAFETLWETSLHDGLVAGTALPAITVAPRADFVSQGRPQAASGDANALELVFRPDPSVGDGQFANNSWLQETPKPVTRLTGQCGDDQSGHRAAPRSHLG